MTESETTRAVRGMFRTILTQLGVLLAVVALGGAAAGWLAAGTAGLWGALLAAGLVALFTLGTAIVMLLTADKPVYVASAAGVGGWIAKMVIVFVVLLIVRDRDFYSPGVFFVVLVVGIVGSLAIEMTAYARARIPIIDASARARERLDGGRGDDAAEGQHGGPRP